jgi:hypothetical protein
MIVMKTGHDCGPVAIANLLEVTRGIPAEETYARILAEHRFPNRDDWRDDLWDSPARHVEVAEALLGEEPVGIPLELDRPAAVLVHLGDLRFHWITLVGVAQGIAVWHRGRSIVSTGGPHLLPMGDIVFAYTIGGPGRPAWWWRVWRVLTDFALLW